MNLRAGLVAFDLDGTLLRGRTVCEILAAACGRTAEVSAFEAATSQAEIAAGRIAMARWYRNIPRARLFAALESAELAPGAAEGVALLATHGVEVVIASITWRFAVEWFATRFGIHRSLGTDLSADGDVVHVWPADKGPWLQRLMTELSIPYARVAAVGDSAGDTALLAAASLRVFVGASVPAGLVDVYHWPRENIDVVAGRIIKRWSGPTTR